MARRPRVLPGTLTVLHAEDLQNLGASTVHEALSFVPGVDASMTNDGRELVIVRGMSRMMPRP